MPLLKLYTSVPVTEEQQADLLGKISHIVSEVTKKPEAYVMVVLEICSTSMGGLQGPAAFADVRGIGGLHDDVNTRISQRVCALLEEALRIPSDRVYLNFTDIPAHNWGWNGRTFAR